MAQLTIFLRKQAIEFSYTDLLNKGGVKIQTFWGRPEKQYHRGIYIYRVMLLIQQQ